MQTPIASKVLNRIGPVCSIVHDDAGHFILVDTQDHREVCLTPMEVVELGVELIVAAAKEVR